MLQKKRRLDLLVANDDSIGPKLRRPVDLNGRDRAGRLLGEKKSFLWSVAGSH